MDRQAFLELLCIGLTASGHDPDSVSGWEEAIKNELDGLTDEEFASCHYGAPDAERLINLIGAEPETAISYFFGHGVVPDPAAFLPDEETPAQETDASADNDGDGAPTAEQVTDLYSMDNSRALTDEELAGGPTILVDSVEADGAHSDSGMQETRVFNTEDKTLPLTDTAEIKVDADKLKHLDKNKKIKKEKKTIKGTPAFWTLFIVTMPITMPILLAVLTIFGVMYLAVSLLIAGLVITMVGIIGLGTALALVGLIYGIVKTFSALPVGLYEIGLGIAVGGATMLFAVLIYNLAVRMVPKLYTYVNRFVRHVMNLISGLYYTAKKEVGR